MAYEGKAKGYQVPPFGWRICLAHEFAERNPLMPMTSRQPDKALGHGLEVSRSHCLEDLVPHFVPAEAEG